MLPIHTPLVGYPIHHLLHHRSLFLVGCVVSDILNLRPSKANAYYIFCFIFVVHINAPSDRMVTPPPHAPIPLCLCSQPPPPYQGHQLLVDS
jgi:hypothetical protein